MAGESGGVFGVKVAVGDGGASTFERKRARRSTAMALAHFYLQDCTQEHTLFILVSLQGNLPAEITCFLRPYSAVPGRLE